MKSSFEINNEVEKEARKGIVSQFTGVLSALLPVLAILGINADWFNQDFIDSLGVLLVAIVALVINVYSIWKNHYSSKKAQMQNKAIKREGVE